VHCILYEQDPVSEIAPFVYATDVSVNGTYLKKYNTECAGSQGHGILMGRTNTFLLDEGDELHISDTVTLVFFSVKPILQTQFTAVQEREKAIFARDYLITGRLLGEGGYGKVLIGIEQSTQRQLACKMIRLDHMYNKVPTPNLRLPTGSQERQFKGGLKRWPTRVAACFREFDILKDLRHPNIVSIEKVFWSNNTIYIFQELVTGGDLFSFIEFKGGRLDNAQATVVIRQILIGLEYLHDQEIVHRDLKPDNILMTSLEDGARVVITDFGSARFLPVAASMREQNTSKYQRMFSYVGTLEYTAPEIHKANPTIPAEQGYSKSVDMWSIGSITAAVLSGDVIFTDRTDPRYYVDPRAVIFGLAAQCDLSVIDDEYHPTWCDVDRHAKDFIKRLLVLEEDGRMTASEALAHTWFSNECYAEDLEDVYTRSISGWHPRAESSQLVERISKSLPNLSVVGLPDHFINQDTVSRYFHPSEQRMTQNIIQTLSASQHWRPTTPLPSIEEDHDNDRFQYASQVAPSSYHTNRSAPKEQYNNASGPSNQEHQYQYGKSHARSIFEDDSGQFAQHHVESHLVEQEYPNSDRGSQGMYAAAHSTEEEDSQASAESLNNVSNVAYSRYPHALLGRQRQVGCSPEVVLVQDTPVEEQCSQESYQQTQFPEEFQYQHTYDSAEEQASVLVEETPPGTGLHGDSYGQRYRRDSDAVHGGR
jgi:serine/threonine protein kinase